MGTFSRLRYVISANVNALIEKAENPEKLLRALIREMEDASEEARLASADLLSEQEHLNRVITQLSGESELWHGRARRAVEEQQDDLARAALKARSEILERLEAAKQELAAVSARIGQMDQDMMKLKGKMSEAKLKLKGLLRRPSAVGAGANIEMLPPSASEKKVRRALDRFDRLQTQVDNLEARVRSYEVGGHAPAVWDRQSAAADPAVEEELRKLKQRITEQATPDPDSKVA